MSVLQNSLLIGAACFAGGCLAGYWLLRWKERNLREALKLKEQTILETVQRQAETVLREARVQANEEALKL
ncbi:MAG TPA: hypothetical protein VGE41_00225, partial [Verrucomicrobiae bacterium]